MGVLAAPALGWVIGARVGSRAVVDVLEAPRAIRARVSRLFERD